MTRARDLAAFVSNADGDIKFDTDTLFIDSSANRVGIQTATPSADLHISKSSGNAVIKMTTTQAGQNNTILFGDNDDDDIGRIDYDHNTEVMHFRTNTVERLRFGSSETVINEASTDNDFRVESDSKSHAIFLNAGTNVTHFGGSTQLASSSFINCGGVVFSNGLADGGKFFSWDNEGGTGAQKIIGYWYNGSAYKARFVLPGDTSEFVFNDSSENLDFRIESDASANMFQIDAGLNTIAVGKTPVSGVTFDVSNRATNQHPMRVTTENTAGAEGVAPLLVDNSRNTGTRILVSFRLANSEVGKITSSGSTTVYATSSDYRLKENVVDLTGATNRLKQLEPKRFNFIADEDNTVVDGFLAHEVQTVVPESVVGSHNETDADGNPVMQGIDQSKLVPLLVATIQELEARITALENA